MSVHPITKRQWTEDEIAEYQEEMQRLMHERQEAKKWANNASLHVMDPDRKWTDKEDEEDEG